MTHELNKSEIFEVHVTSSNQRIHQICKASAIKTIEVELLTPTGEVLRTEHMTSHVFKCKDFTECLGAVGNLISIIGSTDIVRVKVECPPDPKYKHHAVYVESHFKDDSFTYATSRNKKSGKLLATKRTMNREDYDHFLRYNGDMKREVEMCLLDTFVDEDRDWLSLWRNL